MDRTTSYFTGCIEHIKNFNSREYYSNIKNDHPIGEEESSEFLTARVFNTAGLEPSEQIDQEEGINYDDSLPIYDESGFTTTTRADTTL